jgi:L-aspartate semialdehyde sulfurtransferase
VLDEEMAEFTGVADAQIFTNVFDYSQPTRSRDVIRRVDYAELRTGIIEINGRRVHTAPLSSYRVARDIAETLKDWIKACRFLLTRPVEPLPSEGGVQALDVRGPEVV